MIPNAKASPLRDALFAAAFLGPIFAALTWITWRKWPDLVIDFGAQLYMPWQISTGAVMGRDFHYLAGGPLSQHYHALLFKIFGVSFLTIIVSNLVVLALLLAAIYFCWRRCADQLTALTACVAVLVVFAFAHYSTLGIFNYITPYCAELVHGLLWSVLALALLVRWFETENPWLAGAAGFCAGLTLLTKPDLFLALALTINFAAALFWQVKRKGKLLGRALALMAGAGLIPAAGFFLWFLRVENFPQSGRAVFAGWIPLLTTSAANSPFYQWCLGLDKPWYHLRQTLLQSLGLAGVLALCALVSWRKIPWRTACLLTVPLAFCLVKVSWEFNWFNCGYCLPPVCLALLALLVLRERKTGWDPPVVFATLWSIWSLAVMAKLGVFCRIWHYGFALAMPAFVSGLYFLLWALPRLLGRGGLVRPGLFRFLLWLMLLPGLAKLARSSLNLYSHKTMPFGSGADTILAFGPHYRPMDADMAAALRWLESNVPPGATLTVLPQGAMLNYLSRHANPCGYAVWNPPELAAFGQQKMTDALIAHSPDYLIEMFIDYGEYNETYFGQRKSLGLEAQQWIDTHYQPACPIIGHDWVKDGQFGIKILKRYAAPGAVLHSLPEEMGR
jgi:hypothetical protein